MSELRASARILYNALNFDAPVNFGQEELVPKSLGEDKYIRSLHGPADRDPVQELANQIDLSDSAAPICSPAIAAPARTAAPRDDIAAARTAYRESLELCRRLREALRRHAAGSARSVGLAEQFLRGRERSRQSGGRPQHLGRESKNMQRLRHAFPDNRQYQQDLAWIEARTSAPFEPARSIDGLAS